jgi:hypothetical protein
VTRPAKGRLRPTIAQTGSPGAAIVPVAKSAFALTTVETKHEHTHIGSTAIMTNGKFPWIPCFTNLSAGSPQKIPGSVA